MTPNELIEERRKIGLLLREQRKKAGLTQTELSRKCGLCRYTIVAIETGAQSWTINSQIIYANALKVNAI